MKFVPTRGLSEQIFIPSWFIPFCKFLLIPFHSDFIMNDHFLLSSFPFRSLVLCIWTPLLYIRDISNGIRPFGNHQVFCSLYMCVCVCVFQLTPTLYSLSNFAHISQKSCTQIFYTLPSYVLTPLILLTNFHFILVLFHSFQPNQAFLFWYGTKESQYIIGVANMIEFLNSWSSIPCTYCPILQLFWGIRPVTCKLSA